LIFPARRRLSGEVFYRLLGLLSNWFANGMSEYEVMTLVGHASFSTTHRFYLPVAEDLVDRASLAIAQSLSQKLLQHQFCL